MVPPHNLAGVLPIVFRSSSKTTSRRRGDGDGGDDGDDADAGDPAPRGSREQRGTAAPCPPLPPSPASTSSSSSFQFRRFACSHGIATPWPDRETAWTGDGPGGPPRTQDLSEYVEPPQWVLTQKKTFTRWINAHLKKKDQEIEDVQDGLADGLKLMTLMNVLYNIPIPRYNKNPRMHAAVVRAGVGSVPAGRSSLRPLSVAARALRLPRRPWPYSSTMSACRSRWSRPPASRCWSTPR